MNCYTGTVLSEGVAIGKAHALKTPSLENSNIDPRIEKEKLILALEKAIHDLEDLKQTSQENQEYLDMQILLVGDSVLKEKTIEEINKGFSAVQGLSNVIHEFMNPLLDATSSYLKERVLDLSDIKSRIIKNLIGGTEEKIADSFIFVAEELHPSFLIQNKERILGVITAKGGYSSHSAILCRQFNIPYMIANIEVDEEQVLVLDTRKKHILTSPTAEEIAHYEAVLHTLSLEKYYAVPHNKFGFLANVSDNVEIDKVLSYGFDGIGLYRTEMIFMNSDRPYTLEEQYEIYSVAVEKMKGKSICFRTFDIGDDKQLSYVSTYKKGVDNYIHNPILFKTQIEALLKANHYNTIKIMFPMITSVEEFDFLKKWVLQIQKEIKDSSHIEFGIMLETKEALENIRTFDTADFISIGTNDLVYSIYHIHRDDQTNDLESYLKDLILKLQAVVEFCKEKKIVLSICGELAAIGPALREFVRIGVQNFSVAAPAIKVLNHIYKEFF
ncbi:MAG: hypothetical protein K2K15_02640 [Anaeroplasmataceae bacterium]|nr:hypothetical protein [Anaeroplasmataceae bacterium]